jgi:hypothetical protein
MGKPSWSGAAGAQRADVFKLARELAKPIAHGNLRRAHAEAALVLTIYGAGDRPPVPGDAHLTHRLALRILSGRVVAAHRKAAA